MNEEAIPYMDGQQQYAFFIATDLCKLWNSLIEVVSIGMICGTFQSSALSFQARHWMMSDKLRSAFEICPSETPEYRPVELPSTPLLYTVAIFRNDEAVLEAIAELAHIRFTFIEATSRVDD